MFTRWYTWSWTLKHYDPEGNLAVSAFILPNANAPLTFRIFSWKLVFMHNSLFNVSRKSLNLFSTNLPWEQQESYVLLFDLYSSAKCKLLHALHSFSLSSNECFSTFPLLEAKSFVSCCTLCDVSYSQLFQHHFSFFYHFAGVFVDKLAIDEDKL